MKGGSGLRPGPCMGTSVNRMTDRHSHKHRLPATSWFNQCRYGISVLRPHKIQQWSICKEYMKCSVNLYIWSLCQMKLFVNIQDMKEIWVSCFDCFHYLKPNFQRYFKENFLYWNYCLTIWRINRVFPKWIRNSANSGNLIHWSMNWVQFKDPFCYLCLLAQF